MEIPSVSSANQPPDWRQILPPGQTRSRTRGVIWKIVGGLLVTVGVVCGFGLAQTLDQIYQIDLEPLAFPTMFVLVLAGTKCYLRGKRYLAICAQDLLLDDPRAPVVYLRSFHADAAAARSAAGNRFFSFSALFETKTEEEVLAGVLSQIGPVVAIGVPGEKLPEIGAARFYVHDADWQTSVHALLQHASLVVMRLGDTPGFWWELERSVKTLTPAQLLLVTPLKRKAYEIFRQRAAKHFPHPLPEYQKRPLRLLTRRGFGSVRALIYFQPDWKPVYEDMLRLRWPWRYTPRYLGRRKLENYLNWALRPVCQQLGVEWQPPSIRWFYSAMVVFVLLSVVAVSVRLVMDPARRSHARESESAASRENVAAAHPLDQTSPLHSPSTSSLAAASPTKKPERIHMPSDALHPIIQPHPFYPEIARMAHLQGTVILAIIVGVDGSVTVVRVISGPPIFAQAAQDAVTQWKYQPTLINGNPVEVETRAKVVFQLDSN